MQGKLAFITGSTGYLGSKLCEKLASQGWRLALFVRDPAKLPSAIVDNPDCEILVAENIDLIRATRNLEPDVVFHLAATGSIDNTVDEVAALMKSNIGVGLNILEGLRRLRESGFDAKFLWAGSYWQNSTKPDSFSPNSLYAAMKQAFEDIAVYYRNVVGIPLVGLKPFDIYGDNDPRRKIINLIRQCAINNEPLVMSDGTQIVDMVHVNDVVDAFIFALNHLEDAVDVTLPISYFVGGREPMQLRKLVELYVETNGLNIDITWGARPRNARDVMHARSGIALPDWSPAISLKAGFAMHFKNEMPGRME